MSIRRFVTVIAALLLATGGVFAAPGTAHADDPCNPDVTPAYILGYGPDTVTLGLHPRLVDFFVNASDDCSPYLDWWIDGPRVRAAKGYETARMTASSNADAGASYVDVHAYDGVAGIATQRYAFSLLRATRFSGFNVSPEPVKKGKYVTVKGTLKRADWNKHKYVRYGAKSQLVQIQFKAKGDSAYYQTIKTVKLGKKSKVKAKIKVAGAVGVDGTYRLSYAGNGTSGASVSAGDYVNVK